MAALSRQMSRRSPSEDLERGGQKNEVMMIDIKMMGSTKKMQNYLGICGGGSSQSQFLFANLSSNFWLAKIILRH